MKKLKNYLVLLLGIILFPSFVYADNIDSKIVGTKGRCVVDNGNVFMGGDYLELGISPRGSFGALVSAPESFHVVSDKDTIGLSVNARGFNTNARSTTGDFFLPGTPEERFVIGYIMGEDKDGVPNEIKIAEKNGVAAFPNPIEDFKTVCQCDFATGHLKATTTGISKDNLKITITNEFDNDDQYFKTSVELENLSNEALNKVRYMRSVDPDQDYYIHGTYKTLNKVISNPKPPYSSDMYAMVAAKGIDTNEAFFYIAFDSRARGSIGSGITPTSIFNDSVWIESDPNIPSVPTEREVLSSEGYTENDGYIALTFDLGTLQPKQKTRFEYFSSLNPDLKEGLDTIQTMQFVGGDIKVKNRHKSSKKSDQLIMSGVNIGDKIELYSDADGKNKILSIKVKDEYFKKGKLVYNLGNGFLDDDGGTIYVSIISETTGEKSDLITLDYGESKDTSMRLIWKRLGYITIILAGLGVAYFTYSKYRKKRY